MRPAFPKMPCVLPRRSSGGFGFWSLGFTDSGSLRKVSEERAITTLRALGLGCIGLGMSSRGFRARVSGSARIWGAGKG